MTAKVRNVQNQLEGLNKEYQQYLQQEQNEGNEYVTIMAPQTQLAQRKSVSSDPNLKKQEFREWTHILEDHLKKYEKNTDATLLVKLWNNKPIDIFILKVKNQLMACHCAHVACPTVRVLSSVNLDFLHPDAAPRQHAG